MDLDPEYIGAWKQLDGSDGDDLDGGTDLVCLHISDLHGQLVPEHHVYYDNPESRPDFDFGDDDRILRRGGGIPLLAAKLAEIRSAADELLFDPYTIDRMGGLNIGIVGMTNVCTAKPTDLDRNSFPRGWSKSVPIAISYSRLVCNTAPKIDFLSSKSSAIVPHGRSSECV